MNCDAYMTMKPKPDHNSIILRIIKSYVGDANKRTQAELTDECIARGGINITERQTRVILRELIDNGAPIISTPAGGYYWYNTEEERTSCYKRLRHKGYKYISQGEAYEQELPGREGKKAGVGAVEFGVGGVEMIIDILYYLCWILFAGFIISIVIDMINDKGNGH